MKEMFNKEHCRQQLYFIINIPIRSFKNIFKIIATDQSKSIQWTTN